MSTGKLILHSIGTRSSPIERVHLITNLQKIGLLGQPMGADDHHFLTGDRFLQLISFVGCSTNVCLTPGVGQDSGFCHLAIIGPFDSPRLLYGQNTRPPRCPACKTTMPDWEDNAVEREIRCACCDKRHGLEDIAWGKGTGYGRIFIQVENIFPGEAQPVQNLLTDLGQTIGSEWGYFFSSGEMRLL